MIEFKFEHGDYMNGFTEEETRMIRVVVPNGDPSWRPFRLALTLSDDGLIILHLDDGRIAPVLTGAVNAIGLRLERFSS